MNWFELLTSHLAGPLGYAGVLLLLMVCGLGVPVPEDIILISGGYIAAAGGNRPWSMMVVGLAGILIGDSIIYYLGWHLGLPIARRKPLNSVLTPERLKRVEAMFKKYGQIILLAARFMPGFRAVAFFSAGTTKVPYYRFIAFDGSAAMVSAPLWVYLGYKFGAPIIEKANEYKPWIFGPMFALLAIFVIYRLVISRKQPPLQYADELTPRPLVSPLATQERPAEKKLDRASGT